MFLDPLYLPVNHWGEDCWQIYPAWNAGHGFLATAPPTLVACNSGKNEFWIATPVTLVVLISGKNRFRIARALGWQSTTVMRVASKRVPWNSGHGFLAIGWQSTTVVRVAGKLVPHGILSLAFWRLPRLLPLHGIQGKNKFWMATPAAPVALISGQYTLRMALAIGWRSTAVVSVDGKRDPHGILGMAFWRLAGSQPQWGGLPANVSHVEFWAWLSGECPRRFHCVESWHSIGGPFGPTRAEALARGHGQRPVVCG